MIYKITDSPIEEVAEEFFACFKDKPNIKPDSIKNMWIKACSTDQQSSSA